MQPAPLGGQLPLAAGYSDIPKVRVEALPLVTWTTTCSGAPAIPVLAVKVTALELADANGEARPPGELSTASCT